MPGGAGVQAVTADLCTGSVAPAGREVPAAAAAPVPLAVTAVPAARAVT